MAATTGPTFPPAVSSPAPSPSRLARLGYLLVALPRAVLRRPGRSLAILGLLLLIGVGVGVAGVMLWASYHLRTGRAALQHYHTAEAIPHLQAALAVWPNDPETLLLAARAARRSGSFDSADHLLDSYQEMRGEDEDLTLERVCVRAERGEPDSVSKYCRSLIEQDHAASPLLFEALAKGELRGYQPHKAEKLLEEWLQRQPDNPQALLIQGQVYDLEMRQADAVKSYRAALTADPTLDEARLRLCDGLMQLGSVEEAEPHLEYLSRRIPNNLMVQVYRARIQDRLGNGAEAERMLEAVLARQPRFVPALVERGKLAWRAGQTAEAEKRLRQAVEREPGDYQAHYQLFLCLEKNSKHDEAQKEQERLRQIEQDLKEIQAIAGGAMEQSPHNADLHYQVGMISLRAGSVEEGLRWLHSALKEDPNHQRAHQALMEHYQRIGDLGRAREHRQKLAAAERGAR
ncbi:MAG TPA: tetratricopeptide repeat protein [Gemmataceae bacterium]|nr:tetratricopeptide repeat protein [Gemmataceae bacterium]